MSESPVVLAEIPLSNGWRQIQIKTEKKFIYKQIQIQRQIFSRPVLLWLRSHSVVGPRDNPGPVSAALDLPDPLYVTWGKISRIGKFQIYKSTNFMRYTRYNAWLISDHNEQGSDLTVQPGDGDKHCTCDISYDMKCGQTPGWCWQLKNVRQDTGVHQRPAGNWGSCSCWESESDSEKEEAWKWMP